MRTQRVVVTITIILILGTVFTYWSKHSPTTTPVVTGKVPVVATFYPLAHFAEQVGGDRVTVTNVTSSGVEPHDYEPTPKDIITVKQAKLFLFNGSGLDHWAEKLQSELLASGVRVVEVARGLASLSGIEEETGQPSATSTDPHTWLDPVLAQNEVRVILAALQQADPAGKEVYQRNADVFLQRLSDLDAEYRAGLTTCVTRKVVTAHAAFGYLAKRYNLEQLAIAGISPEVEPSAKRLAELATLAKKDDIHYIFFETLVSPKLAETLAREVGAKTAVFNPLEGLTDDELATGATFVSVMQENLRTLRTALQCS